MFGQTLVRPGIAVKINVFNIYNQFTLSKGSQVVLVVKNPLASVGDVRHGFSPWVGKIPWRRAQQVSDYPL